MVNTKIIRPLDTIRPVSPLGVIVVDVSFVNVDIVLVVSVSNTTGRTDTLIIIIVGCTAIDSIIIRLFLIP